MKPHVLASCLLLVLTSCFTRRTNITPEKALAGKELNLITSTGFNIRINAEAYITYLKQQKIATTVADSISHTDTVTILSLMKYKQDPALFQESSFFIMQELNKGKATVINLSSGKQIQRLKRVTHYYKNSMFVRGAISATFYYSGRKQIFGRRYARICF